MGRLARLLLQRLRTGHVHLLASRRRSRGEPSPSFRRTSRSEGTVINQGIQMIDLNWDLEESVSFNLRQGRKLPSADAAHWSRLFWTRSVTMGRPSLIS